MVLFNADKFKVRVVLDDRCARVVGSTVVGQVLLECAESCEIRGLILRYICFERKTKWETKTHSWMATPEIPGAPSVTLHDVEYVLLGSRCGSGTAIPQGSFCYPFALAIPTTLPPSMQAKCLGEAGSSCCCCSVDCCTQHAVLEVVHRIHVAVIIPWSFVDNESLWRFHVRKAIHPDSLRVDNSPAQSSQSEPAYQCQLLCPIISCFRGGIYSASSFTLVVPQPIVPLDSLCGGIPFKLLGSLTVPARVSIVRSSYIAGFDPHVWEETIVTCIVQGIPSSGVLESVLAVSVSQFGAIPSFRASGLEVQYFVRVYVDLTCWADVSNSARASVKLRVYHCSHRGGESLVRAPVEQQPQAPIYIPTSPNPLRIPSQQPNLPLSNAMPQAPPPLYVMSSQTQPALQHIYQYTPPPNFIGAYRPAAPVNEPDLPPAEWGIVLESSDRVRSSSSASDFSRSPSIVIVRSEDQLQSPVASLPRSRPQTEPAEPSPAVSALRDRLSSFFTIYAVDQMFRIDYLATTWVGRENELFQQLVDDYGPEPQPA